MGLKGRILLAAEGINGTLSGESVEKLQEYQQAMGIFDLIGTAGYPDDVSETVTESRHNPYIFRDIDWKESSLHSAENKNKMTEPFPNLKVSIVKELVSSGGAISVNDLETYGGTHLTPQQFHEKIVGSSTNESPGENVVLIDVRNTFEHAIGHFVNPHTQEAAMNPEMVTFSSFDPKFCEQHAPSLRDKTVLMYCTGGIRCEKASAMLKKRGVQEVYQLSGGIHRYLESYGQEGCFRGRNFQFDQRVSLTPAEHFEQRRLLDDGEPPGVDNEDKIDNSSNVRLQPHQVVGKCFKCSADFDELSGSRICSVCRDLVLVCTTCQAELREYHCRRHAEWKAYYTFLEVFDKTELESQRASMQDLLERHSEYSKHVRKTLRKQIKKINDRLAEVEKNPELVVRNAPRRCRSCRETEDICNGLCWGFWKTTAVTEGCTTQDAQETIHPISVGDTVRPGPHWNSIRYGSPNHPVTGTPLEGTVSEIKSWGTGSVELDCVAVEWNNAESLPRQRKVQIYRWGAKAVNGSRLYDVARCQ